MGIFRSKTNTHHFNRVFHYKPSILGYPYVRKHPYIHNRIFLSLPCTMLFFGVQVKHDIFLRYSPKKFFCFGGGEMTPGNLSFFHNFLEHINMQKRGFRWHKNPKANFLKVHSEFIISESFLTLSPDLLSNEPEAPVHSSGNSADQKANRKWLCLTGSLQNLFDQTHLLCVNVNICLYKLPKTKITADKWWLEDYFPFGKVYLSGAAM